MCINITVAAVFSKRPLRSKLAMAWPIHHRWVTVVITHIMLFQTRSTVHAVATKDEVCLMESFHPVCGDDSVIVIQSALYGRMRPSDCDPVNTGNYGCSANVLEHMDEQCSGKSECNVAVPDSGLMALNKCPRGHLPYLEISYICLSVTSMMDYGIMCASDGVLPLAGPTDAIIASNIVYSSTQASALCTITVQAGPGQRIRVTLVDFNHGRSTEGERGLQSSCQRYAVLTEVPSGIPTTVCRGLEREQSVYLSESHQLQVRFGSTDGLGISHNFLLKFSAVGCADPDLNGNELTDRSPQTAELHCHSTGKTQRLVCEGQEWDATAQSCDAMIGAVAESWSSLEGLLITLVIGIIIGVIMACMVMCCVWLCTKGRATRKPPRQIIYYEGTSQWNAAPPIDNWDGNNALIVDYDTRTLRKKDYEPVYYPLQHDAMMAGGYELAPQSDKINRSIFDDLPPLPSTGPVGTEHDNARA